MAIVTPTLTGYRDVTQTLSRRFFGFLSFSESGSLHFGEILQLWHRIF